MRGKLPLKETKFFIGNLFGTKHIVHLFVKQHTTLKCFRIFKKYFQAWKQILSCLKRFGNNSKSLYI